MTIDETVKQLLVILAESQKDEIRKMKKDDLIWLHIKLGKDIRNAFGLNSDNTALLGNSMADDVSMDIIVRIWEALANDR